MVFSDILFFFFKQKTAYELRISDWSSDVCSSDLRAPVFPEILMTYHDVEWLKANEDQIPVIVSECDKIMNSELKQSDLPIPVAKNCGGIKSAIASINYSRDREIGRDHV